MVEILEGERLFRLCGGVQLHRAPACLPHALALVLARGPPRLTHSLLTVSSGPLPANRWLSLRGTLKGKDLNVGFHSPLIIVVVIKVILKENGCGWTGE